MMIRRSAKDELARHPDHECIFAASEMYCEGDLEPAEQSEIVAQLATAGAGIDGTHCCVIHGRGSVCTQTYRTLKERAGLDVFWDGPCLPLWAWPVSWIVSAHAGVLHVTDLADLPDVFQALSDLAMVELYFCCPDLLNEISEAARQQTWKMRVGPIASRDQGYLCLGVDGDSQMSNTGSHGWASWGPECPHEFKRVIEQHSVVEHAN